MEARDEGQRSAGWWADRSIRTKGLVVLSVPILTLLAVLGWTSWFTHVDDRASFVYLLAVTIVGVTFAIAAGLAMMQLFTSGVTNRLRRLERATATLVESGELLDAPTGADEIGRLSGRLLTAASQLHDRAEERDRVRKQLEDILTTSPVVSLRYEIASHRFSYASPNVERLLGISAAEATADPSAVIDRFHPSDAERLHEALVGAIRRSRSSDRLGPHRHTERRRRERVGMTLRFRRDANASTWGEAEAIYTLEHHTDGSLAGVVAYLVDASERHLAQRSADERRSMLETIFHASPDTIVVRDVAGRVILASSTLADVIGFGDDAAEDAHGAPVAAAAGTSGSGGGSSGRAGPTVAPNDRVLLESLTARSLAGEPTPDPVITTSQLPSGGIRTFETRARTVLDAEGQVSGTVTVSRDVTDRVRLEQSLRDASAEAARASEAKSEFLSRMSHELRTPLNAMLGFTQLLELDELTEDQTSSVDQIQRAGRHLLSLINEVLDISRIEAGRLVLTSEPVQVGDVLDEVVTLLMPAAETGELELSVITDTRDLHVTADRQRLLQVLLNLGSNAVKYNAPGGAVWFKTSQTTNHRVRFEVRDTGPGISPEQQDQLFVPFSRLGAEHSEIEGTGVGLALSRQLVELMGGGIGVESAERHGSTFWVELPVTEPPAHRGASRRAVRRPEANLESSRDGEPGDDTHAGAGPAVHPAQEAERSVVVLQVEDNVSNAALVEQILSRRSEVHLVTTGDAESGMELARKYLPHLILLDLHLPDQSGEELVYRLKTVPELVDAKIVVVSADATPSRIRRMIELGVEGYLTKPVDVEALLGLVDLEIAGAHDAP